MGRRQWLHFKRWLKYIGRCAFWRIEDEKKTAAFLAKGLREAGFVVDLARDGKTGLEHARAIRFDLLIVDAMLPNKDGWEVVAELRRDGIRTPIFFLPPATVCATESKDSSWAPMIGFATKCPARLANLRQLALNWRRRRVRLAPQNAIQEPNDKTIYHQNERTGQTGTMPKMTDFNWNEC